MEEKIQICERANTGGFQACNGRERSKQPLQARKRGSGVNGVKLRGKESRRNNRQLGVIGGRDGA